MSVVVEVTEKNLCIFNQLCEIDRVFKNATEEMKKELVQEALELCEELEL